MLRVTNVRTDNIALLAAASLQVRRKRRRKKFYCAQTIWRTHPSFLRHGNKEHYDKLQPDGKG